jgi:orotate phosphoribosyltransferase
VLALYQNGIISVNDVFTMGGSFRGMLNALTPTKANVLGCYAVVKRGDGKLPVPFCYLLTAEDLL